MSNLEILDSMACKLKLSSLILLFICRKQLQFILYFIHFEL